MIKFTEIRSEPEAVVDEYHVYAAGMSREPGDQELAADGIGRLAVCAGTCFAARSTEPETLSVYRRSNVSGALHGCIQIAADLIHSHYKQHMFRSESYRCHAVCITVDVDDNAVICHGIGT